MNLTKAAPPGLKALEDFLYRFKQTISERIVTYKSEFQTQKDAKFSKLFKSLAKNEEVVVVPKDKTNSYKVALLEDYKHWVEKHIQKYAVGIQCRDAVEIHAEVEKYAESLIGLLLASEMGFLREGIALKAMPQPQLLIKDHKEPEANVKYPTRLVIPATNFTATFLKVGYMAIQKVLDRNNVNYN
eukprot:13580280-Ditylum_brightwellii.AAC.1